jgi:hypothetical protein
MIPEGIPVEDEKSVVDVVVAGVLEETIVSDELTPVEIVVDSEVELVSGVLCVVVLSVVVIAGGGLGSSTAQVLYNKKHPSVPNNRYITYFIKTPSVSWCIV